MIVGHILLAQPAKQGKTIIKYPPPHFKSSRAQKMIRAGSRLEKTLSQPTKEIKVSLKWKEKDHETRNEIIKRTAE